MKLRTSLAAVTLLVLAVMIGLSQSRAKTRPDREWQVYGGNSQGTRYSPLTQINRSNVGRLKVAWSYTVSDDAARSGLQTQPIVVEGILYGNTPSGQILALDGATG